MERVIGSSPVPGTERNTKHLKEETMQDYFNLDKKDSALCSLNGNQAEYNFRTRALTSDINAKLKEINDALVLRNFRVPGLDIQFYYSPDRGKKHTINMSHIKCSDPDIEIHSDYRIRVRQMEFSLHDDLSGSLEVYCGDDWAKDRNEFVNGKRFHRKIDGNSRIVLRYDTHGGNRLEATDDCNRGYFPDPARKEPKSYHISEIERVMIAGLDELLDKIRHTPEQIPVNVFVEPDPEMLTNPLFTGAVFHANLDNDIIQNMEYRDASNNYGTGGTYRLLPYIGNIPDFREHRYSDIVHNGMTFCDIEFMDCPVNENRWQYNSKDSTTKVAILLNKMNNVYVVEAGKTPDFPSMKTEEEKEEAYKLYQVARALSIVPINEYDGSFEKPVVVINRIIAKSEIVVLKN